MALSLLLVLASWFVIAAVPISRDRFYREGWEVSRNEQGEMELALVSGHYRPFYFICVGVLVVIGAAGFVVGLRIFRSARFHETDRELDGSGK